jgi:hypothetical protein
MKPKLKPPGTQCLKLKCDISLSTFAFNFSLRRYSVVGITFANFGTPTGRCVTQAGAYTRSLFSST